MPETTRHISTRARDIPETTFEPGSFRLLLFRKLQKGFVISLSISNYTFIRIIYLAVYFKSNIGKNCQADQIIDTEDICKVAANVLGLSYVRVRPNSNSYCPAGCHWPSSNSDVAFFNRLTDPSETDPEHFGVKGGLCKRTLHSNLTKSNDLS